jgi:hypothetical protein
VGIIGGMLRLRTNPSWKKALAARTPDGYYGLVTPSGWDELVHGLHDQIEIRFPDYQLFQAKEKFGKLRYHCSVDHLCRDIITAASEVSTRTCQVCGASGTLSEKPGPTRVLCRKDDDDLHCTNGYDLRGYTRRRPVRLLLDRLGL